MKIIETAIEDVVIIEPRLFKDERGYFFESFSQREFEEKIRKISFVQDNESKSSYGVLRGLHFQKPPYAQSKLVRVIKGAVLDVAVDIRKGSPTFGKHVAVKLTEIIFSFSYLVDLRMVSVYCHKKLSFNTNVTTSMHHKVKEH